MVRQTETEGTTRRRNVLRLVGAASGLGLLAGPGGAQDGEADRDRDRNRDRETELRIQQDGGCAPIEPLSGEQPVEELYEYAYPTGQFDGPPGVSGTSYSSEGTVDLQRENGSVLFLYDGPAALSLVFVHGRRDPEEAELPAGESDAGGTVSFAVRGLPEEGAWAVLDDYYGVDGEQSPSNYDRYEFDEESHRLHWAYRGGRTDGGAYRGLGADPDVRVYPAFDDAAGLADDHDYGTVEQWEVLSGSLEPPERLSLVMDEPVRITTDGCGEADGWEWSDDAEDRTEG